MSGNCPQPPRTRPVPHKSARITVGTEKRSHRRYNDALLRMLFLEQLILFFDELRESCQGMIDNQEKRVLTLRALRSLSWVVFSCSLYWMFSSCKARRRDLMSSGTSLPDNDARRSLAKAHELLLVYPASRHIPNGTLALEHTISLIDTLALEADLLEEQAVDLLQLHSVLVRQLLDLVPELLDLALHFGLVFVHRLAQGGKDVELILVHKGDCAGSDSR